MVRETGTEILTIPIKGGITEGGAIIIMICLAIITLIVGAIFLVVRYGKRLAAFMADIKADTKETKESTVNSHGPNLRDDIDGKHQEIRRDIQLMFENMGDRFDTVNRRMDGIDGRVTAIDNRLNGM